jgi:hypothetical protein
MSISFQVALLIALCANLSSGFFLGGGRNSGGHRPSSSYGPPKQSYSAPKPSYGPPGVNVIKAFFYFVTDAWYKSTIPIGPVVTLQLSLKFAS